MDRQPDASKSRCSEIVLIVGNKTLEIDNKLFDENALAAG